MQYAELPNLREVLPGIESRADRMDQSGEWPAEDLRVLSTLGAMRWAVPLDSGGEDLSAIELHFRYEAIASGSLGTALILSQRDSAVLLIDSFAPAAVRCDLLATLANNAVFATVGIAQLTTSRQRGTPALMARPTEGGYRIDGEVPWATGAAQSQYVVVGANLEDRRQVLFILPTDAPGVKVQPPLPLMALRGTHTSSILCDGVMIEHKWLLGGPAEQVLGGRRKGLPIGQAFLATGLCRGALDLIGQHDSETARQTRARLEDQLGALRNRVLDYCNPAAAEPDLAVGARLRGESIDLALRTTQAAVALYKGSALLRGHPAQRLAREAMFLLVWSCPGAVVECTLERLAGPGRAG